MKSQLLKDNITGLAGTGRLSHAYILESYDKDNLVDFALNIAKGLTPYDEDVQTVYADGISVKDKAIEAMLARLQLKPMVGDRNIAIVADADTMTHRAQNRLLKTLEEPPGNSVILLLVNNAENLLLTIRSRCVLFRPEFAEIKTEEHQYGDSGADKGLLVGKAIIDGCGYYTVMDILKEITKERDYAYKFLNEMEEWFRSVLISSIGISVKTKYEVLHMPDKLPSKETINRSIALIEAARRELDRRINAGYVIKNMILQMIQEESV
ncbi:hypothetical protein MASR2M70_11290 [Bacillota bacterium]